MKRQAIVLCLALSAGVPAPEPMTLQVYPRFMMAESTASVRLRIEPDPRSREVRIAWESVDGGAGGRVIQLDGAAAPLRMDFPLKRLNSGDYDVVATLIRSDGTEVRRAATLTVLGR